ncbi:Phenazine biosynthesis protein [Rutstroemia sp. NJR-2017a BBW]|nr:Phenazine biosynthesis protein [Rutstroemia sp. NJR-2017a BBW]
MNNAIAKLENAVFKKAHKLGEDDTPSEADTDTSSLTSDTPTLTTIGEDYLSPITSRVRVPWAGETYMICDRKKRRIITLTNGKLQLEDKVAAGGGSHWICIDNNGWFGFRNSVSGTFMGHDARGKFICKVSHHKPHEWFFPRAHRDGGYWLLMLHGNEWRAMSIGKDGKELVEVNNNGTVWEFLKV